MSGREAAEIDKKLIDKHREFFFVEKVKSARNTSETIPDYHIESEQLCETSNRNLFSFDDIQIK